MIQGTNYTDIVFVNSLTYFVSGKLFKGRPGKFSGPPERCYEAEPDEITYEYLKVYDEASGVYVDISNLMPYISDDFFDEVEPQVWASFEPEPEPEYEDYDYNSEGF